MAMPKMEMESIVPCSSREVRDSVIGTHRHAELTFEVPHVYLTTFYSYVPSVHGEASLASCISNRKLATKGPVHSIRVQLAEQYTPVVCNTILGTGMLSMPYSVAACGALPGAFLILLCGCMSWLGLHFLSRAATHTKPARSSSFAALADITYPRASILFDSAIAIKCAGRIFSDIIGPLQRLTVSIIQVLLQATS